jgi:hypothetical protein
MVNLRKMNSGYSLPVAWTRLIDKTWIHEIVK